MMFILGFVLACLLVLADRPGWAFLAWIVGAAYG